MKLSQLAPAALSLVLLCAVPAARGQGSPQDWMKRILDPAKIGVTPFPGSAVNRKLTVDYLSKADPPKEIVIYVAPLDKIAEAAAHFEKTLQVKPAVSGEGSEFAVYRFSLSGGGKYPPAAEGLTLTLSRSQWVDNKAQITFEYMPPAK